MYHFPDREKIDWTQYFRFDKKLIKNGNWARILPAAKAIFPVIGCHCNEHGQSFPGEKTIAALSGLTDKSVRKGISGLDGFPGFKWQYYKTRMNKHSKKFFIELPPKSEKGRAIFFHRGILEGGNWCQLKPAAQALYPVMRYFSYYDVQEDDEREEILGVEELYATRKWELCNTDIGELAENAGINRRSIKAALESLQESNLIEPYTDKTGEDMWKVYLIPPEIWKAGYLNRTKKN